MLRCVECKKFDEIDNYDDPMEPIYSEKGDIIGWVHRLCKEKKNGR